VNRAPCLRCGLVEQDHQAARLVDCPRYTPPAPTRVQLAVRLLRLLDRR
jgi:hypothetical protein